MGGGRREATRAASAATPPTGEPGETTAKVWRAIVQLRDKDEVLTFAAVAAKAKVTTGALGYHLKRLEGLRKIGNYTDEGLAAVVVLQRPADMPLPTRRAASPVAPAAPASTKVPARSQDPVDAPLRQIIRFLAKDVGLVVMGPDDDDRYSVERKGGYDGPKLLELANEWRAKRDEPPFRLVEEPAEA